MDSLHISTVIPTYNRAHLVPRAVASALAASSPGDEVIVVDDGSTDDTAGALAPLMDRIRYVRTENGGAGAARLRGFQEAGGDLVALLDSDDEWMPRKLELQRALMQARPDVTFCFTEFAKVDDETGATRHNLSHFTTRDPRPWDEIIGPGVSFGDIVAGSDGHSDIRVHIGDIYLALFHRSWIFPGALVAWREAALEACRGSVGFPINEEWIMMGRLARGGTAALLDCEMVLAHEHRAPQLIDAAPLAWDTTAIRALEGVWGADEEFLAEHGDLYRAALRKARLRRALHLLLAGDRAEARAELRRIEAPPKKYRALASLPTPLARGLLRLYRRGKTAATGARYAS